MRDHVHAGIMEYVRTIPGLEPEVVHDGLGLMALHREIEMLADTHLARQGLTARQMETLETLYHHSESSLTPAELADAVMLTRSAMTSILDALEKQSLVLRGPHDKDRRMVAITLTPEGVAFCEERFPRRYAEISRIIGKLTHKERSQMRIAYNKVIMAIRDILEEDHS